MAFDPPQIWYRFIFTFTVDEIRTTSTEKYVFVTVLRIKDLSPGLHIFRFRFLLSLVEESKFEFSAENIPEEYIVRGLMYF